MAVIPSGRGMIRDANLERGQKRESSRKREFVDTFAPDNSRILGDTTVRSNPVMDAVMNFGSKLAAVEVDKMNKANYLEGQALAGQQKELPKWSSPASRQGYEATQSLIAQQDLDASIRTALKDPEMARLSPEEFRGWAADQYASAAQTGNENIDNLLMSKAGPGISAYAQSHYAAHVAQTQHDQIQTSSEIATRAYQAMTELDPEVDAAAYDTHRQELVTSLATITDPEARAAQGVEVAMLGLEQGNRAGVEALEAAGIELDSKQMKQLNTGERQLASREEKKQDMKYQADTADMEKSLDSIPDVDSLRTMLGDHQTAYPGRKSNEYYIGLEKAWHVQGNNAAKAKSYVEAARTGDLALIPQISNKARQKAMQDLVKESQENPLLSPEEKDAIQFQVPIDNGLIYEDMSTQFAAGFASPIIDGKLNPDFEEMMKKLDRFYLADEDTAMRHLSREDQMAYRNINIMTKYLGMGMAAAVAAEKDKTNDTSSTVDKKQLNKAIGNEVKTVMGTGFFSLRAWTDTIGATEPLANEGAITQRLEQMTRANLDAGYLDVKQAAEAARIALMETHEQVGNSLVYTGDESIAERMGVPKQRTQAATDHIFDKVLQDRPDFNRDNMILLGDPTGPGLMIADRNEHGGIVDVVSADLAEMGRQFRVDVIGPEQEAARIDAQMKTQESIDAADLRRERIQVAMEDLGYSEARARRGEASQFEYAKDFHAIRRAHRDRKKAEAEQAINSPEAQKNHYGVETDHELDTALRTERWFGAATGLSTTEEQVKGLQAGDFNMVENAEIDKDLPKSALKGEAAVAEVTRREGELTEWQKVIVRDEGYAYSDYPDVYGITTSGVGQTAEFQGKSFKATAAIKYSDTLKLIPKMESFSQESIGALVSSVYRGSLSGSPKTVKLINAGDYAQAANEFLDNEEYRKAKADGITGIVLRMERTSRAIRNLR